MQPVHFYWSRSSLRLCLVMSAGIFLLGLPMVVSESWDMRLVGLVWIALFGWLVHTLMQRMGSVLPVITVEAAGLIDRRIMHETLTWEEIASIETFEAESMTWVGLQLADHKKSMPKMSWLVRLCAPLQHLMRFPRVSISMVLLEGSPNDLLAAVDSLRPRLIVPGRD